MRPPAVVVLAAALSLVALTGCAGARQVGPRAAAEGFFAAVSGQDGAAACRLLAPQTRAELVQSAGEPCGMAVLSEHLPAAGPVRGTQVWGRTAQVRATGDTLFEAEFETGWLVVAAGCRPQAGRPYDCLVTGG